MNELAPLYSSDVRPQLHSNLQTVESFVKRSYLSQLSRHEALPMKTSADMNLLRLFHISKIIYDKEEDVNEKLTSIYSSLLNSNATVFVYVVGEANCAKLYFGVRHDSAVGVPSDALQQSFKAHFPGSDFEDTKGEVLRSALGKQNFENVSAVTVVPSLREDNKKEFVQGVEKLIDTMQGKEYTALFISTPIGQAILDKHRLDLEQLYTAISPYAKTTVAYGENQSDAIAEGTFKNFTSTVNEGISETFGESFSVSESESRSSGFEGFSSSHGTSYSQSASSSDTRTHGTADSRGYGSNQSKTVTTGTSQTYTNEITNKTAENLLACIDEQLERMKSFDAFGAWETAAYFCAGRIDDSLVAANAFKALASGEKSNTEHSYVNTWSDAGAGTLAPYLSCCRHPLFELDGGALLGKKIVTAGNYISGKELPVFMSLPQKSVSGVTVTTMAEFGRNVSRRGDDTTDSSRKIPLGVIHHMGKDEEKNKVSLDLDSLTSHCFVCGSTGSGKSNTVYHILEFLARNKIPFLVVEPAKGEYAGAFGAVPGINIFHTNPYMGAMLKINPFEFHPGIHVLEHLDRLIEIFNSCWEMYAAMPAILKNAVEKAYVQKGWDLLNSIYIGEGQPQFPTFDDLLSVLPTVIRTSGYSSDTQSDYTGALVTRVQSLTTGISGQIFCDSYSISDAVLFDETTIVDLSRIGSAETKSLIMGVLVMRLNEYRMASAIGSNRELRHVTILEEAHNLLKNVSQAQGQQTANPIGKSVEMICNSIAEMRTYGEGFIIVDQSPSSVDIAAIKNTNTKLVLRLPEKADCEAVGNAIGLNENQIKELAKLPVGVAAVMQNNWLEAVLCKIDKARGRYEKKQTTTDYATIKSLRSSMLCVLLEQANDKTGNSLDYSSVADAVQNASASEHLRRELLDRARRFYDAALGKPIDYGTLGEFADKLIGAANAFSANEHLLVGKEGDCASVAVWEAHMIYRLSMMVSLHSEENYKYLLRLLVYRYASLPAKAVDYSKVFSTLYLNL